MRILALRPKGIVLPSVFASVVEAFRSLGIEVLDIPLPQCSHPLRSIEEIIQGHCQAIFTLNLGADPSFIAKLKELQTSLRIPWITWFVDDPEGYGFPEVCDSDWTLPFCWDEQICSRRASWNGWPLVYLPLATDPTIFHPEQSPPELFYPGGVFVGSTAHRNGIFDLVASTTPGFGEETEILWRLYQEDFRQSLHDLAWIKAAERARQPVGLLQKDPLCRLWAKACVYQVGIRKRQEVASRVLNPDGCIFGDEGWGNKVGKDLYRGWVAYGKELRAIYCGSAFILDVRPSQARTGLTQRVFDASACGSPVVAEWAPEIEALFDPENELSIFYSLNGAVEMKELCLRDLQGAQRKAGRARQRVLAHHTYYHRAEQILKELHRFRV